MRNFSFFTLATAFLLTAQPATAETFVYPADGQSEEQMNKDKGECRQWAVDESGIDLAATLAGGATPVGFVGRLRVGVGLVGAGTDVGAVRLRGIVTSAACAGEQRKGESKDEQTTHRDASRWLSPSPRRP